MSQEWSLPFSQEEFLAAYRRIMPEEEARQIVAMMMRRPERPKGSNIEGYHILPDTLDLLAAVSDDLSKRVARYREEELKGAARAAQKRDEWLRRDERKPEG